MEPEIEGLINEGWTPRIKTRKNRKYITLRKGNKEKSLGPYSKKLWDMVKPVEPWATPSQISELEKRIAKIEENQRGSKPSLDALLLKRIKQLEESQRGSKQSYDKLLLNFEKIRKDPLESAERKLEKRIKKIERAQRVTNPSLLEKRINKLEEMRKELLESAERRLKDDDACKHIDSNGFCLQYYFPYSDVEKFEYLRPGGRTTYKGKTVYYINVRENPIVCSACPDYEPKS